ncbi:MAG: hypothetical protein WAV00_07980 [Nocardioides sp.]
MGQVETHPDRCGPRYSSYVPRKAILGGQKLARAQQRARRNFGRIERLPSGRYRDGYTGPDGQLSRAPTTFDAKDDAIAWLSARRAEIQMEVWAPDDASRGAKRRESPTFGAYADLRLESRKTKGRELRPTTRRQYRMLLDKFILPTFGDQRIDRITNEDVNAWYDDLAPGRETIRAQSYSLLRTIFASAASERSTPFIPYNPARTRCSRRRWPSWRRSSPSYRPLPGDGAARCLVRDAVRRTDRAAPRRRRPAGQPGEDPSR